MSHLLKILRSKLFVAVITITRLMLSLLQICHFFFIFSFSDHRREGRRRVLLGRVRKPVRLRAMQHGLRSSGKKRSQILVEIDVKSR